MILLLHTRANIGANFGARPELIYVKLRPIQL